MSERPEIEALVTKGRALTKRFFNGAVWSFFGTLTSQLLLMGATVIVSHIFNKREFGSYILLQTTLTTLGVLVGLGLGTLATRYTAALKHQDKDRLERIITLGKMGVITFGLVVVLLVTLISDYIAVELLKNADLRPLLLLSAGAVLFTTLDNYQKSVIIGFERLKDVAFCSFFGALGASVGIVLAAYYFGITGAATAMSGVAVFQYLISRRVLKRILREYRMQIHNKRWRTETPLIFSFGLPALIANIIVPGAMWITQAMLARTDNGYGELALFGIAMQWFNALMFVPSVANKVLMPMLTELIENQDGDGTKYVIKHAFLMNLAFTFLFAIGFSLLSKVILLWYGGSYSNGSFVLTVVALAAVLASLMNVSGNLLSAHSRMWLGSLMNFGWSAIYISLAYYATARGYGALGVACSLLMAYIAHFAWSAVWVRAAVSST
jgi:O-antigen/teichoic acid export membrane protein